MLIGSATPRRLTRFLAHMCPDSDSEPIQRDSLDTDTIDAVSHRIFESNDEDEIASGLETLKNMVKESELATDYLLQSQFIEAFLPKFDRTRRYAAPFILLLNHLIIEGFHKETKIGLDFIPEALECIRSDVQNPLLVRNSMSFLSLVLWRDSSALSLKQKRMAMESSMFFCSRVEEGVTSPNLAVQAFYSAIAVQTPCLLSHLLETDMEITDDEIVSIYQMISQALARTCRDKDPSNAVLVECLTYAIPRTNSKFFDITSGYSFVRPFCELLRLNDPDAHIQVFVAMRQIATMDIGYFDPYMLDILKLTQPLLMGDMQVLVCASEFLMVIAENQVYHSALLDVLLPVIEQMINNGAFLSKRCATGVLAVVIQMGSRETQAKLLGCPTFLESLCEFVDPGYQHVERVLGALCCAVDMDFLETLSQNIPEDALEELCRSSDLATASNARYIHSKLFSDDV